MANKFAVYSDTESDSFAYEDAAPANIGTTAAAGTATDVARGDHVHDLPFSVLNTVLGEANAALGINSQKITSVADPTAAQDAATKNYVDNNSGTVNKVNTTDATVTTMETITPVADSVTIVEARVVGTVDEGDSAGYRLIGTFKKNTAGTVTQVGFTDIVSNNEDNTAWVVEMVAAAATIVLRVTGAAATVIDWTSATVKTTAVIGQ